MTLFQNFWLRRSVILEWLVIIALSLYGIRFLTRMPADFQWDFRIYYDSADTFLAGATPYDTHPGVSWEYTYLPMSLWVFVPFTSLQYEAARALWIVLQATATVVLILLWRTQFLRQEGGWLFYIFCLFAYNATLYINIRSGNVALIEQPFIWLAFLFFLKRRYFLFCLFLLVAGTFKALPLFFLLLLYLSDSKKKHAYFLGTLLVFAIILGFNYALAPKLFIGFIENALGHTGFASTSNRYLIEGAFNVLQSWTGINAPQLIRQSVFWVVVAVIILVSLWVSTKLKWVEDKEKVGIFFTCMTYGLIIPNLGDYAYMLFIVPAYYIFKHTKHLSIFIPLLTLASLSPNNKVLAAEVWNYYAVLVAWGVWGMYVWEIILMNNKTMKNEQIPNL
jgi:hypothetical protein